MKAYIATFHGDLESHTMKDPSPIAGNSLEDVLEQIVDRTGWGTHITEEGNGEWDEDYIYVSTPDPEDDKVEIWEVDGEKRTAKIVAGFWGWHWQPPNGDYDLQMVLPGHTKTLYQLAMDDY